MKRSRKIANFILCFVLVCAIIQVPAMVSDRMDNIWDTNPFCFPAFVAICICMAYHIVPGFKRFKSMGGYYTAVYVEMFVIAILTLIIYAKAVYKFRISGASYAPIIDMVMLIGIPLMVVCQFLAYMKE